MVIAYHVDGLQPRLVQQTFPLRPRTLDVTYEVSCISDLVLSLFKMPGEEHGLITGADHDFDVRLGSLCAGLSLGKDDIVDDEHRILVHAVLDVDQDLLACGISPGMEEVPHLVRPGPFTPQRIEVPGVGLDGFLAFYNCLT